MNVSSEVKGVWGGRILKVTTLLGVECFQSGETQAVLGAKLFLSLLCAMKRLWSHLQSDRSNGKVMDETIVWTSRLSILTYVHSSSFAELYADFCARVSWDPCLLATCVLVHSSPVLSLSFGREMCAQLCFAFFTAVTKHSGISSFIRPIRHEALLFQG